MKNGSGVVWRQGTLCALMLIAVLTMGVLTGCSATQVAQDIVNYTPALESGIATVDSTASILLPADAPIFAVATAGLDAAINELDVVAKAYLANPSATVLARLQSAAVAAQQSVNAALLKSAGIKDAASQAHALQAINTVASVVTAILGLVQSISTKAQVARMSADSPLKLAEVRPYLDERRVAILADKYGTTPNAFFAMEAAAGF